MRPAHSPHTAALCPAAAWAAVFAVAALVAAAFAVAALVAAALVAAALTAAAALAAAALAAADPRRPPQHARPAQPDDRKAKTVALAYEGSGNTRQRRCLGQRRRWRHTAKAVSLAHEGSRDTRQMRCLTAIGSSRASPSCSWLSTGTCERRADQPHAKLRIAHDNIRGTIQWTMPTPDQNAMGIGAGVFVRLSAVLHASG